MRKMVREVLCSNPGTDKKVLEQKLIPGRFYGGSVKGIFLIPIRLGSRLWNDKQTDKQTDRQTNQHSCFCPDFSTVRTHLLTQLGIFRVNFVESLFSLLGTRITIYIEINSPPSGLCKLFNTRAIR